MKTSRHSLSLHPLAACLALVLGAPAADAAPPHVTAFVVQNCLDHGPGSLRQAVIDAPISAPIDLTQLTCSGITLTTGRINVERAQLIQGPGAALFTIDGAGLDRVFNQNSTQTLALYGMTIRNGYTDSFGGGCVYSAGALQLKDTVVRNCRVSDIASSATVKGGGALVHGPLTAINSSIVDNEIYSALGSAIGGGALVDGVAVLDHSTISGNVVASASGNVTAVGGIDVGSTLTMMYSTVSNNRASGLPNAPGTTGGARALYGATITQSTISGNSADGGVGGLNLYASGVATNKIIESTISGNSAAGISGLSARGNTSIMNSTIAFNTETGSSNRGAVHISYAFADLQSTIIAANASANGQAQNIGLGLSGSVSGANNLIGSSPSVSLPAGTIGGDPKLLPLHDNGGWTKTHALRAGSPAVDAGNVVSGYTIDQRGTGFPRVVGAFADIGAFEGVDADSIFYNGFD
jgi:hypothetical protein